MAGNSQSGVSALVSKAKAWFRWILLIVFICSFGFLVNMCSQKKQVVLAPAVTTSKQVIATQPQPAMMVLGSMARTVQQIQVVPRSPLNQHCPPISYVQQTCEIDTGGSGQFGFALDVHDCAESHLQPTINTGAYAQVKMVRGTGTTDVLTSEPVVSPASPAPGSLTMEVIPKKKMTIVYWAADAPCHDKS